MANCLRGFLFSVLILFQSISVFAHDPEMPGARLVTIYSDRLDSLLRELSAREVDIAGVDLNSRVVSVVTTPAEYQWLVSDDFTSLSGFVISDDAVDQLAEPDPRYFNPETIEAALKNLAAKYPENARLIQIGQSVQGRPIWALRVGSGHLPGLQSSVSKISVLFNGLHHAREVMTPEVVYDIGEYLLSNYASSERVKAWVDQLDIWLVPMVNPDGSARVFQKEKMWRKNARSWLFFTYGVDLNRNYAYDWGGEGSSGIRASSTYKGTRALSEPESKAMDQLNQRHRFGYAISYHSFGEMVLYPFSSGRKTTSEEANFADLARGMAYSLKSDVGDGSNYAWGKSWEILYAVGGGDDDHHYANYGTMAMTVEVNSWPRNFQPEYDPWRAVELELQRPGWQFILDRAVRGPGIALSGISPRATVRIQEVEHKLGEKPLAPNGAGFFYHSLQPGTYNLEIAVAGKPVVKKVYEVSASGPVRDSL